jgi:hypothetical protein
MTGQRGNNVGAGTGGVGGRSAEGGQTGSRAAGGAARAPAALSMIATVIAIIVIGAYLLAIWVLWPRAANTPEIEWLRLVDLRGGLEALAFAAAGALFGTTVQRQATKQAEKNADQERQRANANERAAAGGTALAGAVRAFRGADAMQVEAGEPNPLAGLAQVADEYGL